MFLAVNEFDVHQIDRDIKELCSRHVEDIPTGLRRFLRDLHQHTWFSLYAEEDNDMKIATWTHTRRGTRPGSPLADIAFSMMMAELLKELNEMLLDSDEFVAGATGLGTFVPPIAWMQQPIQAAWPHSSSTHGAFKRRGLSLNLNPGKTELLMCFRGEGAVARRKALLLTDKQPAITVTTDTHTHTHTFWPSELSRRTVTWAFDLPWTLISSKRSRLD